LLDEGDDVVGSPDGLAVVRVKEGLEKDYPTEWLFAVLRSEQIRLQLWTESGGTSYGKLDADRIREVLVPVATANERKFIAGKVQAWAASVKANIVAWSEIGIEGDRRPILNSPLTGLFDDDESEVMEDEYDAKVAQLRLAEINSNPKKVLRGKALDKRLNQWQA
ncbi:MAG: hypothetical protein IID61_17365, partial [SAR324 cluster bacterium]|nr:hypothetical protein [SAR324 cluster bacterium]